MMDDNNNRASLQAKSIAIVAATPDVNSKGRFNVSATLMPQAVAQAEIRRERACAKNVCCCYCVQ
jgi:hypothetical protein